MHRATAIAIVVGVVLASATVRAQTGVSDDRVSLPEGPGSIEGLGDNATVDPNMGQMSYAVPIRVPRGFPGVTPDLALRYGSGSGSGIAGMGWSLAVPSIERLTLRGLPSYDADDEFVANGGEQLVRVASPTRDPVYRARFEGAFVRYTWHGAGAAGYWTAEYPDGRVGYFGASAEGVIDPDARLTGPAGQTFRYHLVELVDVHGHRVRYGYQRIGGVPYLRSIGYVHAGSTPRYAIELRYEPRPDPISDAKPGFEERVAQRLASVRISAGGEVIRTYVLHYQDVRDAGGASRLARVEQLGRGGMRDEVELTFGYSRALGAACATCDRPYVVDMGTLPNAGSIGTGDATLVDLDGDTLPDVVDSSQDGPHRFVFTRLDASGAARFDPEPITSRVGERSGFRLSQPQVQLLDIDGDGFADLVNNVTGRALCNRGRGDWSEDGCLFDGASGIDFPEDAPGDADPRATRFLDVDADRRIDVLHTSSTQTTTVQRNTGTGFEPMAAQPIGALFDTDRLLLADLNGDGMLDPTSVGDEGEVRYRLNLGFARWGEWTLMDGPAVDRSVVELLALEDVNADGLDDLVLVAGSTVQYALNRHGRFDDFATITNEQVDGGLPARGPRDTVLFADMNGNGTRDVVWIEPAGRVRYLELFVSPPHLLSRIENGVGMVQEIAYGTTLDQRLATGGETWAHPLPFAMNVVVRYDTWVTLTGLHEVQTYRYANGFYDGEERQLRGFAWVEQRLAPDGAHDTQEAGRTVREFDVGDRDPYRAGRLLVERSFSGDAPERALRETHVGYDDCDVAEATPLRSPFAVRHVCEIQRDVVLQEGAPAAEWATLRTTRAYDGYGNVVREAQLGVVSRGGVACGVCTRGADAFGEACGEQCLGDEQYVDTTYVAPGASTDGRWILGRPVTVRRFGREGGEASEESISYDGDPFVGLPPGRLTRGLPTRVTARRDADVVIEQARRAFDEHGNTIVEIDPNGSPDDATTHRRSHVYDPTGLRVVRTDVHLVSPEGEPYRLRREYSYEPAFDQISDATSWMLVQGETIRSARHVTSHRYDGLGRRIAIVKPGDTFAAPTMEISWELGAPASRIRIRERSVQGGPLDLERVQCLDGRGRAFQERHALGDGRWQVSGFRTLNARGAPVREHQPHLATSDDCSIEPPSDVAFETVRYDASGREIRRTLPDASIYGEPSIRETQYLPLAQIDHDEEDLDPASPHAGTPTITRSNGLGLTVAIERRLAPEGSGPTTRFEHDGLGRVVALIDPAGHRKTQRLDRLGRTLEIDDPSSGLTTFEHDDAGNVIARTDARGVVTRIAYDGANRPSAQWDDARREETELRFRYDLAATCDPRDCTHAEGQLVEVSYPLPERLVARMGGDVRGVDRFGFDARGQRVLEQRTVGGFDYRTRYTWDDAGRPVLVVHPDGRRVSTTYDGASRPIAIDGVVAEVAYEARGRERSVRFENGALDSFEHDARMRIVARRTTTRAGEALADFGYEYDRAGNVERAHDDATLLGAPWSAEYEHDAWYRVTSARFEREGEEELQSWSYDTVDDVVSATSSLGAASAAHLGELAYDATRPNTIVRAGAITFEHDDAGQLVRRGDTALEWDHLGRLVRARRDGEVIVELAYGPAMTPVATIEGDAVTLYVTRDFEVRDGVGVLYTRLGERRVARATSVALAPIVLDDVAPLVDPDGAITAADARALEVAGAGARAGVLLRSACRRLLVEAGDAFATLHTDHLGSVIGAIDADGAARGRRRFRLPAGAASESGYVDTRGFSGQEELQGLDLVRFEQRWLEPTTLRWTRPDPAFHAPRALPAALVGEAVDAYAYVGNGLVSRVDPRGLTGRQVVANAGWALHRLVTGDHGAARVSRMHREHGGLERWLQGEILFAAEGDGDLRVRLERPAYEEDGDLRADFIFRDGAGRYPIVAELKVQGGDRNTASFLRGVDKDATKLLTIDPLGRASLVGMQMVGVHANLDREDGWIHVGTVHTGVAPPGSRTGGDLKFYYRTVMPEGVPAHADF
ncbi:toxin TcdB middle/N-terminal domain-containing protein [Sandaracinus amylolyticus]|uniref:toxin TcdB middle/N-terminal domain-containing protein n=1 Tax=Sandaracinus amylolyticus TaxID=927083 RepID=UPI001F264EC9|nr:toxin TcdB middle/N-terminal domain-containing protein [Sandaracinus amylolyticus]